ncbi:hypothetical protein A3A69_02320 [candidate division WWE3 bacterium RIFCSPLOWO2_01_FULL_37_15]|uniref:General secretion pathway GspH domain-containing protein n=1 Tax=candidate division WWE3 bacterium RIFCSPLOWO2_01_FULL_37_15 TaxID=1802622 RepID=A0A1F4UY50_UNCKA|nr:MAG: hypothetical protein A3A69_02320 [candidate division WWE3 bacterium RIFCSPLOWO2_01_FULL_37_15]
MNLPVLLKSKTEIGVTLIELLLVISIIGIVGGVTAPVLSRLVLQINLNSSENKIVSTIKKAQEYSMDGKGNGIWGLCMSGSNVILYDGTCLNPLSSDSFLIPATVIISGLSDTNFNLRGEPSNVLNVSLGTSLGSRTIQINSAGGVNVN